MSHDETTPPPGIDPATWDKILHIREGCYPDVVPGIRTDYGYHPTLGAGITFCALFGIAILGHAVQIVRFRRWTSVLFAIGAISKVLFFPQMLAAPFLVLDFNTTTGLSRTCRSSY